MSDGIDSVTVDVEAGDKGDKILVRALALDESGCIADELWSKELPEVVDADEVEAAISEAWAFVKGYRKGVRV